MSAVVVRTRFALSSGACEALKWLALASMLVDHVNNAFFDYSVDWMVPIGRFAMPVFSLLLGYNMARPGADHARLLKRLLLVGLIAQPFHALALCEGDWIPLNVLFTFAVGVGLVMLCDRQRWALAGSLALFALVVVDYSVVGFGLLAVACWYFRTRSLASLAAVAVVGVALCLWNGNVWAAAGFLTFAAASTWQVSFPRARWAFWVAYPLHLAVLAGLLALGV